jgi:hypothetical protein
MSIYRVNYVAPSAKSVYTLTARQLGKDGWKPACDPVANLETGTLITEMKCLSVQYSML